MVDQAKFNRALDLLRNPETSFTAELVHCLSDLTSERLEALRAVWADLPTERRQNLMLRLVETAEMNFELDFSAIVQFALDDPDSQVRKTAIEGVIEDNSVSIMDRLIKLAQEDPFSEVRAAAAGALGMFVLEGEFGKLPEPVNLRVQDAVLALYHNLSEDIEVRRRALEAISNCGREGVADLIREAYYADELPLRVSAVFAMGRSCDEVWAPQVLDELSSDHPEMRFEATRAAGEIQLHKALPRLIELAYEEDREVQEMAIWALGEIGGRAARSALTQLATQAEDDEDDELAEAIEEAQANASLSGESLLPLFELSDFDDDDLDDDLDDLDDVLDNWGDPEGDDEDYDNEYNEFEDEFEGEFEDEDDSI
jgi:HEAT repeat protein